MIDKAARERQKRVQSLKVQQEKTLKVRDFLFSEREIVIRLLEKALGGQDRERVNNLRIRIQEKDRQLHLTKEELKEIKAKLVEAESRFREAQTDDPQEKNNT
jgi:hypothetical protein